MSDDTECGEPGEGSGQSWNAHEATQNRNPQGEKPQNNESQNHKARRPNLTRSTTADSVFKSMSGDPKTTRQLDAIMSQLDPDGQAHLADLASRFASGARRKGRIDEMEVYREQNPWHDTPREKPHFSLGEPFPRKDGNDQQSPSLALHDNRDKAKPVFSLGEPLPRTVRRTQRAEAAAKQQAEDDVEQGLRQQQQQQHQEGRSDQASPASNETSGTGEMLQGSQSRQSISSLKTQRTHRGAQDQGTDMAQKYRVSDWRSWTHFLLSSESQDIYI